MLFQLIQNPYYQLLTFFSFWLINLLFSWRNTDRIVYSGCISLCLFVGLGSLIGISSTIAWNYYLHLVFSLAAGYALFLLSALTSEKWGEGSNGEGWLATLVPVFITPIIIIPCLVIKLVVHLVFGS